MKIRQKEIFIPRKAAISSLLEYISEQAIESLQEHEYPIRMAITKSDDSGYYCELGTIINDNINLSSNNSLFHFQKRSYEDTNEFNIVFLVPTGVGAAVGGHSGDAAPAARLMANCCDNLILHPNVVNASDINEQTENSLYVEGSIISRLLMGSIGLQKTRSNRVLVLLDQHEDSFFTDAAINSVNAARAAMGMSCAEIICLDSSIEMKTQYAKSGSAVGQINYLSRICEVLKRYRSKYDAIALSSVIDVPDNYHLDYFQNDMVNPWGGVEAMLTHAISTLYNVPSAHSPMMSSKEILDLDVGVVEPRKSAEAVSTTYLHCILKGLHKSPRVIPDINLDGCGNIMTVNNISCLVIPDRCVGLPTLAATEQGITVIAVRDAENCMKNNLESLPFKEGQLHVVDNYLEAAGVATAIRGGIAVDTVKRPVEFSTVRQLSSAAQNQYDHKQCIAEGQSG